MEESLARIPFRVSDELTISSMAKWMKFVGIFTLIVCILGLVGSIILFALAGTLMGVAGATAGMDNTMGSFGAFGAAAMFIGMIILVVVCVIGIWQGYLLYGSGDDFEAVAKTDDADQDFIAQGFRKLRTFFIIEVICAVLTALNALNAAFTAMATC